jgi:hypothetical protein
MKVWVVLHDLALVTVLVAWLRARGQPAWGAIAYAWNPLVLVEFAGSGHNDPTAMLWLVVALASAEKRPVFSALALSVAALTKLAPLVALPFLLVRWPWRARLTAVTLLAVGLGCFWLETRGANSGLSAYWRSWRNNELAFVYLERLAGGAARARWLAGAIVAAVVFAAVARGRPAWLATRRALRIGVLVAPVAHAWYFAWPLVLEPLAPSAPWLLLSLTAVLSYGVFATPLEGGGFHLGLAWRWVEYGVPLALAVALVLRRAPVAGEEAV